VARLVILSGIPGSGKTTFAKLLEKDYSYRRVSTDEIKAKFRAEKRKFVLSDIHDEQHAQIRVLLSKHISVVSDANSDKDSYREDLISIAKETCSKYFLVHFNIRTGLATQRLEKRNPEKSKNEIKILIKDMLKSMKKPEKATIIDSNCGLSEFIEKCTTVAKWLQKPEFIGYGGGSQPEIKRLDEMVLLALGKNGRIIFIPTASEKSSRIALKPLKDNFGLYPDFKNKIVIFDILQNAPEELRKIAKLGDVIYIGGGNTYRLNNILHEKGFFEILKTLSAEGITVVGYSAGAVVLGENISLCGDEFEENSILRGGAFVPFSVIPHYVNVKKPLNFKGKVMGFPDGSGFISREGVIEFVGRYDVIK